MANPATNGNTNFPTSIDTADTFNASDSRYTINLANWLSRFWAAIIALETKVGITGSAVNTTLDYKTSGVATGDKAASLTGTETLTNKTLTAPTISTITNGGTVTLPSGTRTIVARDTTDTLTNKTLSDSTTTIAANADTTKGVRFSIGGTTGIVGFFATAFTTAKTLTFPDITDTIVTRTNTETLSNKTLSSPTMTGSPVAPTPATADNSTLVATTAFVKAQGYATSAGGNTSAVATGSLSTGSRVILNSDGTVSVINGRNASNGTATTMPTATVGSVAGAYDSVSGKVVVVYQTNPGSSGAAQAVVGTVSGTTITFGAETGAGSGFTNTISVCFTGIGSSKVLIAYKNFGTSQRGEIQVGTISGTTISIGASTAIEAATACNYMSLDWDSTSSKALVVFNSADTALKAAVVTVSGTTVTINTPVTLASINPTQIAVRYTQSANVFAIAYYDVTNTNGRSGVVTVSGTSCSVGTLVTFQSGSVSQSVQMAYDSSHSRVAIAYQLASDTSGRCIIGTISGTNISFGSSVTFATGTITSIGIDYDSTNGYVQIGYYNGTDGKAIEGLISGTSITFGTAITTTAGRSTIGGANAVMYVGGSQFVHIFAGTNSAQVVGSFFSNLSDTNFIGFSTAAYTNGQSATIAVVSGVDNNQSGLTAGLKYYVQDDGTLSSTATTKPYAGLAMSATKILIKG